MDPPLAVDIDGTLSRPDRSIDARVFGVLRDWDAPVVVATGKALPYPVALCDYVGIEVLVIAENGGVSFARDDLVHHGDRAEADAVAEAYREAGYDLGWGPVDLLNRWRETEVAVATDQPLEPLREIASAHGLEVVDTGYAYHVKAPGISKGRALERVADVLGESPSAFVAVGDSANDAELLDVVGEGWAVANADDRARAAADHVTDAGYGDGFLEAAAAIRTR